MTQVEQVERIVRRVTSKWRGAPPLAVVEAPADLPVPAPEDALGMHLKGRTWIVARRPLESVARTIVHEVVAHHAMRVTLGSGWRSFMLATGAGAKRDLMLALCRHRVEAVYGDLPAVYLGDEMCALAAERWCSAETGRIDAARPMRAQAAAIAGHVAREALLLDVPVCGTQLLGMLLRAQHRVRYGGPLFGLFCRAREWYCSTSMPKFDPKAPPMSLGESQRLLDRRSDWGYGMREFGAIALLIACVLAALWGVGYWVLLLLGFFAH